MTFRSGNESHHNCSWTSGKSFIEYSFSVVTILFYCNGHDSELECW
jgi:hypothetical protein